MGRCEPDGRDDAGALAPSAASSPVVPPEPDPVEPSGLAPAIESIATPPPAPADGSSPRVVKLSPTIELVGAADPPLPDPLPTGVVAEVVAEVVGGVVDPGDAGHGLAADGRGFRSPSVVPVPSMKCQPSTAPSFGVKLSGPTEEYDHESPPCQ